jgi:hypothetical protein
VKQENAESAALDLETDQRNRVTAHQRMNAALQDWCERMHVDMPPVSVVKDEFLLRRTEVPPPPRDWLYRVRFVVDGIHLCAVVTTGNKPNFFVVDRKGQQVGDANSEEALKKTLAGMLGPG